jgi:hypothetical protein
MIKKEIPIQSSYFKHLKILWTPVSTGVTTFYEIIIIPLFQYSIFLVAALPLCKDYCKF